MAVPRRRHRRGCGRDPDLASNSPAEQIETNLSAKLLEADSASQDTTLSVAETDSAAPIAATAPQSDLRQEQIALATNIADNSATPAPSDWRAADDCFANDTWQPAADRSASYVESALEPASSEDRIWLAAAAVLGSGWHWAHEAANDERPTRRSWPPRGDKSQPQRRSVEQVWP